MTIRQPVAGQGGKAGFDERYQVAPMADYSRFDEHRSREELNALLNYGHFIPASKGLTSQYVETHYPGWTWNRLVRMIQAAGILVHRGGRPPCCDDHVKALHYINSGEFAVEWIDDHPIASASEVPGDG